MYPLKYVRIGGTKTLTFTSANAVTVFLPFGGTPAAINTTLTNPTATSAGTLAAQALALRLNVDFSNAGVMKQGLASLKVAAPYKLAGQTVSQVLDAANAALGAGRLPSGVTYADLTNLLGAINENFDNGTVNKGVLVIP